MSEDFYGRPLPSMEDLPEYCRLYGDDILVRDKVDGRWQTFAFSQLSAEQQRSWIAFWRREGQIPHRRLRP